MQLTTPSSSTTTLSPSKDDVERTMTSAITDMSVAEVRKALSHMRRQWSQHSCVHPFFPCACLPGADMTVSEFAFRFVMGHHHKRHQKTAFEPKDV